MKIDLNIFRTKKKQNKRIWKTAGKILDIIAILYVGFLIYPNFIFPYQHTYENITIYSKEKISDHMVQVLEETQTLLSKSEINDTSQKHDVFLCDDYKLYAFFNPRHRKSFACNFWPVKNIFVAMSDVENNYAIANREKNNQYPLSRLFAHEITHTHTGAEFGIWNYFTMPKWKKEGLCEYVSNCSSYDLKLGIEKLKNGVDGKGGSFKYFKYRMMITYLIQVRELTYKEIIESEFDQEIVEREMRSTIDQLIL